MQQQKISSIFNKIIPHGRVQQYKLNVALLEFIITDSQPFNILKSNGFRKFISKVDLLFTIPCDKTIKNLITNVYKIDVKYLLPLINSYKLFQLQQIYRLQKIK